jgi:hypothetical protein
VIMISLNPLDPTDHPPFLRQRISSVTGSKV